MPSDCHYASMLIAPSPDSSRRVSSISSLGTVDVAGVAVGDPSSCALSVGVGAQLAKEPIRRFRPEYLYRYRYRASGMVFCDVLGPLPSLGPGIQGGAPEQAQNDQGGQGQIDQTFPGRAGPDNGRVVGRPVAATRTKKL